MINKENIKLKFDKSFNGRLFAVQGDTGREFNIQILDDLDEYVDVTGLKLRLFIGNEKEVSYTDGVIVDAAKGKFKINLLSGQLKYSGRQKAQFTLTDGEGNKIGTHIIDIFIEESIENGATVGKNALVDFEKLDEGLVLLKNAEKTLEEAKVVNRDLKENTAKAKSEKADSKETYTKLKIENTNAKETTEKLKENISAGREVDTKLKENTEKAKEVNTSLKDTTEKAKTDKDNLKGLSTEAKEDIKKLNELVNNSRGLEQSLKEIIASGDLAKYVTDPKLQEVLKSYAKKTDLKTKLDKDGLADELSINMDYPDLALGLPPAGSNVKLKDMFDNIGIRIHSLDKDKANRSELATKLSQLTNDSDFKTGAEVKEIAQSIKPDLSDYAKKEDLASIPKIKICKNLDEYGEIKPKEEGTLYVIK